MSAPRARGANPRGARRIPGPRNWSAAVFSRLRSRIAAEAAEDLEPETRFSESWTAWYLRDLTRARKLTEIAESEALTTNPADPAPVASQGLGVFLDWCRRQQTYRRARRIA